MKTAERILIVIILICLAQFVSNHAHATEQDPPSPADVATIYIMTVGLAGIGVPEKAPKVYRVSNATLCAMVNAEPKCAAFGAQLGDAVFYSEELSFAKDEYIGRGVLVHEFTHYLQWVKKGHAKTCLERADRENSAYEVQADYLRQHDVGLIRPERMHCE